MPKSKPRLFSDNILMDTIAVLYADQLLNGVIKYII